MTQAINSQAIHHPNIGAGVQPAGGPPPAAVPGAPPAGGPVAPAVAGAAALPPLAQAQAQHVQQHPQVSTTLLGRIKTGLNAFATAVRHALTPRPAPAPAPAAPALQIPQSVQVLVQWDQTRSSIVTIDKAQYEPMIKALPPNQQAAAVGNLPVTLHNRIDHGVRLFNGVTGGTHTAPPSVQDVSDLMLALYAMAADQGDAFTNGSFSVKDENGLLAQWLDTSPDVYVRSSSHLKAYQDKTVDHHRNIQRGIDIQPGPSTGLPNGHRTVVFGVIPDHTSGGDGPTRRLFVKPESHGCRLSLMLPWTKKAAKSQNMQTRPKHLSDIPETIKHGASFASTRGKQGDLTARKEHFTPDVKTAFKAALKTAESIDKSVKSVDESVVERLKRGKPDDGGGICMLNRNAQAILDAIPNMNIPESDKQKLQQALTQLQTVLQQHDRLDVRLGNEVIIG